MLTFFSRIHFPLHVKSFKKSKHFLLQVNDSPTCRFQFFMFINALFNFIDEECKVLCLDSTGIVIILFFFFAQTDHYGYQAAEVYVVLNPGL